MKITFGDMADAMAELQRESGFYYNPPIWKTLERAIMKKRFRI